MKFQTKSATGWSKTNSPAHKLTLLAEPRLQCQPGWDTQTNRAIGHYNSPFKSMNNPVITKKKKKG